MINMYWKLVKTNSTLSEGIAIVTISVTMIDVGMVISMIYTYSCSFMHRVVRGYNQLHRRI